MTIPYTENPAWADGSGRGTPINAAKLNAIEQGMTDAHNMPKVRVTKAAAQAGIVAATITVVTFDTERTDSHAMHGNSINPSPLTAQHAGFYLIGGSAQWSASRVTGSIYVRLNGTTNLDQSTVVADYRTMSITTAYQLAVRFADTLANPTGMREKSIATIKSAMTG